jgi:dTDP-4-dehydrorhamnose 3,5-epimerase
MPFQFTHLEIPDVVLVTPRIFEDSRGMFVETYKYSDFAKEGIKEYFVQDNHSRSQKNVLRGLHYQNHPHSQGKLVRCVRGTVYDVCVDIRKSSPTFKRWVGCELIDSKNKLLYVPPGFAHGFLTITESAEVVYKCTDEYAPDCERGIIWNDPELNIAWGIADPSLSDKDQKHPTLRDADIRF